MTELSGAIIFEACRRDPEFQEVIPEEIYGVWREFCDDVLRQFDAGFLRSPLTVAAFIQANLITMRYVLSSDYMKRMIDMMPRDQPLIETTPEHDLDEFTALVNASITTLERIASDVPGYLADQGITEEEFLVDESGWAIDNEQLESWRRDDRHPVSYPALPALRG
jgi:hypothetical protein